MIHSADAVAAALGRAPHASELSIGVEIAVDGIDELLHGVQTGSRSSVPGCRGIAVSVDARATGAAVDWSHRAGSLPAAAKGRILMDTFKKTAKWTGIVFTGLLGIVLLGGGKIQSGTLLVFTAFALAVPVRRRRLPLWVRIVLVCAVYGLVISNISTTELPDPSMTRCGEYADWYTPTGIEFVDQLQYIFSGFIAQAEPS